VSSGLSAILDSSLSSANQFTVNSLSVVLIYSGISACLFIECDKFSVEFIQLF